MLWQSVKHRVIGGAHGTALERRATPTGIQKDLCRVKQTVDHGRVHGSPDVLVREFFVGMDRIQKDEPVVAFHHE